jgi:1-acyl-sn-glycerol-3-phosphate acyltransferase
MRGSHFPAIQSALMNWIRLALIVLYTLVLGTVTIVGSILIPGGSTLRPLARAWSWLVLRTCRVRYRAMYHPRLEPSRPSIYIANHQSQFDIPALVLAMKSDFRMVSKRELLYIPVFGWALWFAGFVFIDRTDRAKAIRSLDRTSRLIRNGTSIVVFAEGTRSPDGRLLPFKKGGFILAIQAGVPVVPVSIRGGHDVLPKGSLTPRCGTIQIEFGEPIDTSGYSMETKDSLIEVVRQRIAAALASGGSLRST